MVVEAGDGEMSMKFQLPGGTSLHRDSPRYDQLLDRYLRNEPIDFAFGGVDNPAERLEVHPAGQ